MLIKFKELIKKHDIAPCSILHIGAHIGEEVEDYSSNGFFPVYWVEGSQKTFQILYQNIKEYNHNYAIKSIVSNKVNKKYPFYCSSNAQSSSILKPLKHLDYHKEITFNKVDICYSDTIDNLFKKNKIGICNFINLDIQGAELLALKGAKEYLKKVKYIYSEINVTELYENCAMLDEMDTYLEMHQFYRVETCLNDYGWGDAFWIKETISN